MIICIHMFNASMPILLVQATITGILEPSCCRTFTNNCLKFKFKREKMKCDLLYWYFPLSVKIRSTIKARPL